jgi:enoyl-CoA hydratase/carnithine racemase
LKHAGRGAILRRINPTETPHERHLLHPRRTRRRRGLLQLSRPERLNTMTPAFFPALRDAVQALNAEGRTRVLVISSTGKHFSAGMALDVFAGGT